MDVEGRERASEEQEIIEILIEQEEIDGEVARIAQQYLRDENQLTDSELEIFEEQIRPRFSMTCETCSGEVPISEIPDAMREYDELCSHCRHLEEDRTSDD